MALIKIKEGSLIIEVVDDKGDTVLLARTVDTGNPVTFSGSVVEVYRLNPAGIHVPGNMASVVGQAHRSKIS